MVAIELANEPNTTVFVTGGLVRPGELSLIGAETEASFDDFNCNTFVMEVAGVDAARGVTEYHRQEGRVKKSAVKSADRVIVVADDTKLGRVLLKNIAPLSAIDTLVTDGDPNLPTLIAARSAGVNVKCVPAIGSQTTKNEGEVQ